MNKLQSATAITFLMALTGCASPDSFYYAQSLQKQGIIQVNEVPKSVVLKEGYDLKVSISSAYDFGLNTNEQQDRLRLIKALRPDCSTPKVVNERNMEGETPIGVTMNRYYMDIKCN